MKTKIEDLQKKIRHHFHNSELLLSALTHPSFLNENKLERDSYQRLEFLGDAVLEFLASDFLFKHFSQIREGRLTEIRAALVRTENLAKVALKLDLGSCLFISKGEELNLGRVNVNILADTLEALIAAIYLDSTLESAKLFFNHFIKPELEEIISQKLYVDAKTKLQEYLQAKYKTTPIYKLLSLNEKDNFDGFKIGVYLNSKLLASGLGKNKRLAEQQAAKNALGKINSL
ncbi:ribonuclease III [Candidatus Roizmanbacteria bacterium RIFOXYB2_FULL_41_10]|uniref:Ribonuclease 3 n=1 Tax=Candidatus Roizmanbacteria bacterium RIFOXYA1_FULL_41_12 TaxID=1802082 RepID=A0A1F7KEK3_9BACT|nr:MAG: ribonuclease III [Candidatus Roizmanbacteria bacterium RIFOXYA1_FULL_41_12]OGK66647.1 MAG: ribonuclease III [Candidatus Roizmanbacteria bacterium RIFOXYA2_FULL_41_8]OGK67105.1 MAG: ribonuclease III [Candidatus Roizmanbacteria bacterium RIFOXYB1_FULL_41_27]OGK69034.1 MAG: ribonuclease III [Candidatus Roizmanbacteria bacterium RIFOXYB2_FULL_41_10]OGK71509.1 MAG: ribonuclease III [Candidatus Roizmanbacteria bacterium RIFOXYC1_FULL_41_16]OGK72550.1 MAG: ribonuclease III [Candidatus Roizman